MPRSSTPAQPRRLAVLDASVLPSWEVNPMARATLISRGSITRPAGSLSTLRGRGHPRTRARLASGCWLGFAGWARCPTGLRCKVSVSRHPPCPGFAWRTTSDALLWPRVPAEARLELPLVGLGFRHCMLRIERRTRASLRRKAHEPITGSPELLLGVAVPELARDLLA